MPNLVILATVATCLSITVFAAVAVATRDVWDSALVVVLFVALFLLMGRGAESLVGLVLQPHGASGGRQPLGDVAVLGTLVSAIAAMNVACAALVLLRRLRRRRAARSAEES